ncbi:hypothetical protein [Alkalinema sp. FACHB-956]|uniref:hypothetical protein n=1 Tax=Alkalinema sp. FACHB-956 TaxID=2692768 RepID=UPI0016823940|nr:hypothetical protein [Alkalinema sp. FACHB-956]MBD2329937.1 hypothetical protein [Alkalinema sp. FACHB-956]
MSQDKPSRLDVYLQEYEKLKDEQTSRIGFRDNLLYVNLAAIGGILAFVFSKESSGDAPNYTALLIIPWVSVILGWTYLINDDKISCLGNYFKKKLADSIQTELQGSQLQEDELRDESLFAWEEFNRTSKRRIRRKIVQLLIDEIAFVVPGILSVITFSRLGGTTIDSLVQALCWVELLIVILLGVEIFIYAEPWKLLDKN